MSCSASCCYHTLPLSLHLLLWPDANTFIFHLLCLHGDRLDFLRDSLPFSVGAKRSTGSWGHTAGKKQGPYHGCRAFPSLTRSCIHSCDNSLPRAFLFSPAHSSRVVTETVRPWGTMNLCLSRVRDKDPPKSPLQEKLTSLVRTPTR